MMKKILLAALAAFTLTGTANAAQGLPHMKWEQVKVRTSLAAQAGGYIDSTIFSGVSVESNATGIRDTTVGIATHNWFRPVNIGGAADSTDYCILIVNDARGQASASTFDSLAVAVQVSGDGESWGTALTFKGGTAGSTLTTGNNQTIVSGVFLDELSVNGAGVDPKVWIYKFKNKAVNNSENADQGGLSAWPYIRFVFRAADGTDGFILQAVLGHWETTDN